MDAPTIDDVLAHHGIKGMKWGVRKRAKTPPVEAGPEHVMLRYKPNTPIQAKGGAHHYPSEDAKASATWRQVARASGPQALTNQQMKLVIERMNLESQYLKLNPKQKSAAEKFIKGILNTPLPDMVVKGVKDAQTGKKPPAVPNQRVLMGAEMADAILKAARGKK